MKLASIDIGSNTTLLLIAEFNETTNSLNTILNRYEIPRLSKDLEKTKIISESSKLNFYEIIKNYNNLITSNNCEVVIAKATNAMRIAKNSAEIIKEVREKFGIDIQVIAGEEEARLSYLGSISNSNSEENIVIDIGGGSTEVIYGNRENIFYRKSFPVGVVNLTERFFTQFPIKKSGKTSAEEFLTSTFKELAQLIEKPNINVISVAGTPTTIAAIKQDLQYYDELKVENYQISLSALNDFTDFASQVTPEQILEQYPFIKGREDVLFAGSLILTTILNILGASKTTVSGRGLRYGILIDYLFNKYPQVKGKLSVR